MQIQMDGRTALITGGSRGLGRAMAMKFAQAGANVAITARRGDVLEETKSEIEVVSDAKVGAYACDVCDAGQIVAMHESVSSDFGTIDILVNNAGSAVRGKFEEVSDETWQDDLDLKLFAAIRVSRLVLPKMKEQKWGRIINVLNTAAKAPHAENAPTAISRAAGMSLTKVLSKEYAPYNILVNALCTGIFVTDLWDRAYNNQAPDMSFEQFIEERGKGVPLGRMGNPEEYANAACFLASDAASYITGVALNVDGGTCPIV